MSVYFLSPNPSVSVSWLDDVTLKASPPIVGSMLSEIITHIKPPKRGELYKVVKRGTVPEITAWAMSSSQNFNWVSRYGLFVARLLKDDKYLEFHEIVDQWQRDNQGRFRSHALDPFPNAARDDKKDFTYLNDIVTSYRYYFKFKTGERKIAPVWSIGQRPDWF